jgi:hypothetical protein
VTGRWTEEEHQRFLEGKYTEAALFKSDAANLFNCKDFLCTLAKPNTTRLSKYNGSESGWLGLVDNVALI